MYRLLALAAFLSLLLLPSAPPPAVESAGVKIFVQWAKASPQDWLLTDTGTWPQLQSKAEPVGDVNASGIAVGDSLLNQAPGWVFAVNVQGVEFAWYDHFHVTQTGTDVIVTAWQDDPILFPAGLRQADVYTFHEPKFDNKVGQVNTDIEAVIYADVNNQWWSRGCNPCGTIVLRPWSEFTPPTAAVKHGIYLSDAKWNEHLAVRTAHGWKEWAG